MSGSGSHNELLAGMSAPDSGDGSGELDDSNATVHGLASTFWATLPWIPVLATTSWSTLRTSPRFSGFAVPFVFATTSWSTLRTSPRFSSFAVPFAFQGHHTRENSGSPDSLA